MPKFERKQVDVYTPELASWKASQPGFDVRREYAILRKRAEQRLRDLKAAGYSSSDIYRDWKNRFPTLKEIGSGAGMDRQLLYDALSEVTRFLAMKRTTVGGYREVERKAEETFRRHYGDELPAMSQGLFGELMQSIKTGAVSEAYYRGWKGAYRKVLSNAGRAGLSEKQLVGLIKSGDIRLGPKGGLWNAQTGRRISGKWKSMGS